MYIIIRFIYQNSDVGKLSAFCSDLVNAKLCHNIQGTLPATSVILAKN